VPDGRTIPLMATRTCIIVIICTLCLATYVDHAACRPAITVDPGEWNRSGVTVMYSSEQLRPELVTEHFSRGVIDVTGGYELRDGLGLWARARGSGAWTGSDGDWTLTDIEFGPAGGFRDLAGRYDIDGWLTFAAPSGENLVEAGVGYGGAGDWSYGGGARVAATVWGTGKSSQIALVFDLRYRSQAMSDGVYLPHHSLALAGTEGTSGGAVISWQARIEMRSERARLATIVLREEPLDAGSLLIGKEKPFYVIQSAGARVWKGIGAFANGELLLSGDKEGTSFEPRSALPSWGFSVGLAWEYGY